jgi:hypothetical protein
MTIRWFTDADREDMRNAKDERRFLDELDIAEIRRRGVDDAGVPITESLLRKIGTLRIEPFPRRPD